ncbi:hypothetical protein OOZ63_24810 [Paucibacter sp. PLA-PC-4]|uniref:hypothetical protein n=1 Tax=Paucibacter sp. PLA-PC-4 TaxID=2993655 RepID=UPI00224AA64A|nr:hypothetical protein [Paucibacter sp. PLA-PC-4]MCX2865053.1 hypothetical protein [Paucibacter sp. PLA-PC-4]
MAPKNELAQQYFSRHSFPVLAQQALISRSARDLKYASLYMRRCLLLPTSLPSNATAKGSTAAVAAHEKRLDAMRAFCGHMTAQTADRNLMHAIGKADEAVRRAQPLIDSLASLKSSPELRAEMDKQDAELVAEFLVNLPPPAKKAWLHDPSPLPSKTALASWQHLVIFDTAVLSAVCLRWRCDTEYRMLLLCSQLEACAEHTVQEQLQNTAMLALPSHSKAERLAIWAAALRGAERALDALSMP